MPNTTTYTWDEENRLTNITLPNGGNEEYSYAADSLRRSKSVNGQTTRFLWDAENLLQEQRDSQTIAHYTNQPDGYGPLLSQRREGNISSNGGQFNAVSFGSATFNQGESSSPGGPTSSFYGFDPSGNTRLLTSESGIISDSYVSTAFGKAISQNGSTANAFRFGGEVGYYQDSGERNYVRARHLSRSQGRWISRDPIGFRGMDWNLYRYVGNAPVTTIDPLGLQQYPWGQVAESEWNTIINYLKAPEKVLSNAEKTTHQKIAQLVIKGAFARWLLNHYIWSNGQSITLTKKQVLFTVRPVLDIRKSVNNFISDVRSANPGTFKKVYIVQPFDKANGAGGLGTYTIYADVTVCKFPNGSWNVRGTATVNDYWDFNWTITNLLKEIYVKGNDDPREGREIRTAAGSFISGDPFQITSQSVKFFQKSSMRYASFS